MILRDHTETAVLKWDGIVPGTFGGFLDAIATSHFNKMFTACLCP